VAIAWKTRWALVPLELGALVLWNEVHFFAVHWLLHRPWLYRHVHRHHHRSVRPTPFATYAMHPVEAVLLGSVMLAVLPFVRLDLASLVLFPLCSLLLNTLGHLDHDLVPGRGEHHPLAASRRHQRHHAEVHGNHGFLLPVLDALFGTRLGATSPRR
jgi:Delta7-sterol 5-desaturase